MATVAVLVYHSPNHLRYRIDYDGVAGTGLAATITTTGAATPDLLTDSQQGPIKKLAKVITNGFAQFASGAQTQAKARALWLSDRLSAAGANPAFPGGGASITNTNPLVTTAICKFTCDINPPVNTTVDANVDGGGNPIIVVTSTTSPGVVAVSTGFLDVEVAEAIGI